MERLKKPELGVPALSAAVMYVMFEIITGSLFQIQGIYHILNLRRFYLIYLTAFSVTNSMRIGYILLNFIFYLLGTGGGLCCGGGMELQRPVRSLNA